MAKTLSDFCPTSRGNDGNFPLLRGLNSGTVQEVKLMESISSLRGWRRGSESNRRIKVLQTSPLPLGYRAPSLESL